MLPRRPYHSPLPPARYERVSCLTASPTPGTISPLRTRAQAQEPTTGTQVLAAGASAGHRRPLSRGAERSLPSPETVPGTWEVFNFNLQTRERSLCPGWTRKGQGDCNRAVRSRSAPAPAVPHLASRRTSLLGQTPTTAAAMLVSGEFRPHALHVCSFFCNLALMRFPLRLAFDLHFSQMVPKCGREAVRGQRVQDARAGLLREAQDTFEQEVPDTRRTLHVSGHTLLTGGAEMTVYPKHELGRAPEPASGRLGLPPPPGDPR